LPFRKGRGAGWLAAALAGWRIQAIVTAQSGFPFTPELAVNSLNDGGVQLPNRVGNGSLPSATRTPQLWFNTSLDTADPGHAFAIPSLYHYGNSGFNILRGPGLFSADASIGKEFKVGDASRLQTRVEAYNLPNRTNLALPTRILGVGASGAINHTAASARRLQVTARLEW
jgi:hypothetical protein